MDRTAATNLGPSTRVRRGACPASRWLHGASLMLAVRDGIWECERCSCRHCELPAACPPQTSRRCGTGSAPPWPSLDSIPRRRPAAAGPATRPDTSEGRPGCEKPAAAPAPSHFPSAILNNCRGCRVHEQPETLSLRCAAALPQPTATNITTTNRTNRTQLFSCACPLRHHPTSTHMLRYTQMHSHTTSFHIELHELLYQFPNCANSMEHKKASGQGVLTPPSWGGERDRRGRRRAGSVQCQERNCAGT